MKKLLLTFSLIAIHCSLTYAQTWAWGREAIPAGVGAGDPNSDHPIVADSTGNAYITGSFSSSLTFGSFTLTTTSLSAYLVKYSRTGNVLWARQGVPFNNASYAVGISVEVDISGNSYLTGYFRDTVSFGPFTLTEGNGVNVFLVKYDANGNELWAKQALIPNPNFLTTPGAVGVDIPGYIYVGGEFSDTISFGAFTLKAVNGASQEVFLVKYDANGNALWARQSVSTSSACLNIGTVAVDTAGNSYITGTFRDTVSFGTFTLRNPTLGNEDVFIVKYDANGNAIWAKQGIPASGSSGAEGISVSIDGEGSAYVAGTFYDTLYLGTFTLIENIAYGYSNFLARYDYNGNLMWVKQVNSLDHNDWRVNSVYSDALKEGGCYFIMYTFNAVTPHYSLGFGSDIYTTNSTHLSATTLIQVDSAGNPICGNMFSEGDEDDGDGVAVDPTGRYVYITGDLWDTTVFGKDTLLYGNEMPFVARWQPCDIKTDTTPAPLQKEPCGNIFVPNAFSPNNDRQNDVLYVRGNCITSMTFAIYDRWGNKVFETTNPNEGWDGKYRGDAENAGTYVYYLKANMRDGTIVDKKGNVTLVR